MVSSIGELECDEIIFWMQQPEIKLLILPFYRNPSHDSFDMTHVHKSPKALMRRKINKRPDPKPPKTNE